MESEPPLALFNVSVGALIPPALAILHHFLLRFWVSRVAPCPLFAVCACVRSGCGVCDGAPQLEVRRLLACFRSDGITLSICVYITKDFLEESLKTEHMPRQKSKRGNRFATGAQILLLNVRDQLARSSSTATSTTASS